MLRHCGEWRVDAVEKKLIVAFQPAWHFDVVVYDAVVAVVVTTDAISKDLQDPRWMEVEAFWLG